MASNALEGLIQLRKLMQIMISTIQASNLPFTAPESL